MRCALAVLACCCAMAGRLSAADPGFFAGVLGGISTLSADGRTVLSGPEPAASSYKPENGPALNLFAGWHTNGYLSVQGNYVRNTNDVAIMDVLGDASFEQARHSSQDAVVGDGLLYFRNRSSWARPYLSAGLGAVRIESRATAVTSNSGSLPLPPQEFSATRLAFRVAVGIDLMMKSGWGFRYSFSETMSGNPFSLQLAPAGQRRLANFQNLFGIVKYFGHRS
ncbi:MAG TPA: outer membrane beta-barrel protein [Bryobacteraceae bacterium]|nr:outer membrane beta-barrel protein [Bryobacteraceae bacterium]